jgi:enterobactin synthetase component D
VTIPFELAWVRAVRFGVLAAIELPQGVEPVAENVLARLAPEERARATQERGRRQIEFVGGRLAARSAAEALGLESWAALLPGKEREPLAPVGVTVSITHKTDLAIALVAPLAHGHVGIDLEGDGRERMTIASRICRPEELSEIEALPESQRWHAVLMRFAIKEAVYKAVFPVVRHFFGFQSAHVALDGPGIPVTLFLTGEHPRVSLETEVEWLSPQRLLAMVRARQATDSGECAEGLLRA